MIPQEQTSKRVRWVLACCLALPLITLLTSYLALAFFHGTFWLGNVVVHESGRYTLLETIFYTRHFMRELPMCVMTAAALAIALYRYTPLSPIGGSTRNRVASYCRISYLGALSVLLLSTWSALEQQGLHNTLLDVLQYRTRDNVIRFGSHWQYHLLHLFFVFPTALGLSYLIRSWTGRLAQRSQRGRVLTTLWWTLFILASITLGFGPESFTEPLYLAHQIREIATHAAITIPLALGTTLAVEEKLSTNISDSHIYPRYSKGILFLGIAALAPAFILIQLSDTPVLSLAQKQSSYVDLFASHAFEHTLDYVFTIFLTVAFSLHLYIFRSTIDAR